MTMWNRVRSAILLVALVATLGVFGGMLLAPAPLDRTLPPVEFPAKPALPGWEAAAAGQPNLPAPNTARYRCQRENFTVELETQFIPDLPAHYVRDPLIEERFLPRGKLPLDAGMHFYVNSHGSVIANLHTDRPTTAQVDSREGGYGIWSAGERLHLSTIVMPAGDTAMTTRQVARSLYFDHLSIDRVAHWLFNKDVVPDRRCVLIHFSIPADAAAPEQGRRVLEESWGEWRRVHFPVFPPDTAGKS